MNITFAPNTLYYGDCLDIMNNFPGGCIDLICLDPPFNSKRKYNQIFKAAGLTNEVQIKAFDDTWTWDTASAERVQRVKRASANPASKVIAGFEGFIPRSEMLSYTSYMAERLFVMHRILKNTGSIYLHCDPTASHYLKLIMDAIFGKQNFRNEIVWLYGKWTNISTQFQKNHDILLFYSKSDENTFNKLFHTTEAQQANYERGYHTNRVNGVRQLIVYDKKKAKEKIESGQYDNIVYQTDKKGAALSDGWTDISIINSQANERLGYPTQKPTALYERIIQASSNTDDLVLDPFAGCGTTIEAALKHDRRVIGIDVLPFALRLINNFRVAPYARKVQNRVELMPIRGIPVDFSTANTLAKSDPFKFQDWAISLIPGLASNPKKVGDDGIDGYGMILTQPDNMERQAIIVQVTGASGPQKAKYDRLKANIIDENAAMGILITLHKQTAARNWSHTLEPVIQGETSYPPIQCFSIQEYYRELRNWKRILDLPALANPWTGKEIPGIQMELL